MQFSGVETKSIVITSCYPNEGKSDVAFQLAVQNMVSGRGVETQQGTACVVFIDGEYWGLYTLQSDYSDRYFADRYNVAKSNVVMYKNDELSEGEAEDEKLFNDMYKFSIFCCIKNTGGKNR